jgi:hypothetical protein
MKSRKKTAIFKNQGGRAYFRLLGLKRGESRVSVIRSAAQALSVSLTNDEPRLSPHVADDRRARIAVAAYRLLDPRERSDLYERVQLVFPIDREEMETPVIASNSLVDQMPPISDGQCKNPNNASAIKASSDPTPLPRGAHRRNPRSHSDVKLMEQPVIDEAIDDAAGADRLVLLERGTLCEDSNLTIEERRSIVRALKNARPSAESRSSTSLAWFRTKLGI